MIYVLHAYSDANLGDRLLVELTLSRLESLGVRESGRKIVALDEESFGDLGEVVGCGTARRVIGTDVLGAAVRSTGVAATALTRGRVGWGQLGRLLRDAEGLVAVGGGYLRAGSLTEQVGVCINHLPQLFSAARASAPAVYLPQSVGPLRGPVGRVIRSELSRVNQVWVRDDTSMTELALPNSEYMPDLAVLDVADREVVSRPVTDSVVLIARQLDPGHQEYLGRLRDLLERLGEGVVWATQSGGAEEKSDNTFYSQLGVQAEGSTIEVIDRVNPGVVVSVRLHGSIMALARGHPTIHLSYQRKGWSAMRDLGLSK